MLNEWLFQRTSGHIAQAYNVSHLWATHYTTNTTNNSGAQFYWLLLMFPVGGSARVKRGGA
jgi:hypothetical protein